MKILTQEEAQNLIDMEKVIQRPLKRWSNPVSSFWTKSIRSSQRGSHGPDVSREGVQRDLLPLVEGSTVSTKYGPVKTDHILFIASGAFHASKPSDLIPELQGRFPIRVELNSLEPKEFVRILTEPKNALLVQYPALLQTEGVSVSFESGVNGLPLIAEEVNAKTENIGARRLHTIMECLLEDILFDAPDMAGKKDGDYGRLLRIS